jgi:uncharacterized protein (DUF885 family)
MTKLLISLLIATAALTVSAKPSEGERFNQWLDTSWEETLQRDPILATSLGDPRYNAQMVDDTTAAWRADHTRHLQRQLLQLKGFNPKALSDKDRLSYAILKLDLEQSLQGNRFPDWMQPLNQLDGLPSLLAQLGSGRSLQPFRSTRDYDDWMQRLSASLPIMDGTIANMRVGLAKGVTPPRAVMEKVLPQLAALIVADPEQSVFWGAIKEFPEAVPTHDQERITAQMRTLIATRVMPAYQRMHDFLKSEYIPKTRTATAWSALPDGKRWYAYRVLGNTTTTLSPEQIHKLGQQEVSRILAEMESVRKAVKFDGDLKAFFQHLQDAPQFYYQKPEDLLAGYSAANTHQWPVAPAV